MKTFRTFFCFTLPLILFIFGSCNTKKAESPQVILGPYLQNMSDEEAAICWATMDGTIPIRANDSTVQLVNHYRHKKSILTRLESNTEYSYDILSDGTNDGKGTFRTFPDEIAPFHFCVLGDTRTRHNVHQNVVNKIIAEKPLFVVNTGDLVSRGNSMEDWEHFFRINKELIRNVPYFTVLGNHEQDSENYYNFFDLPGNESYYFFSVGDALFIILDMEGPDHEAPLFLVGEKEDAFWENVNLEYFKKEKKWLENILTMNDEAGYIFVFFHPTYYSIKKSRVEDAEKRRAFWGDVFERHHVTAVMNGHDHYYHHAVNGGTHYIVTAGGGAPLYDTDALQPETVKYKKIEHYMRVDVGLERAVLKAIEIEGDIIEEITVEKRN